MAFDKNDPAHLAALKSEEADDPIGMGYLHDGATQPLLDQFNFPSLNVGGEISGIALTVKVLFDNMVPEEFGGNQIDQGKLMWITTVLNFMQDEPDRNIEEWRAKIIAILPNNSVTETTLDALSRSISRAEVLFGDGTEITKQDWRATRES